MAAPKKSPQELLAELSAKYSPGGGAVPASPQPTSSTPAATGGEPAAAARARPPIIPPRSRTGTLTAPPPPPPPPQQPSNAAAATTAPAPGAATVPGHGGSITSSSSSAPTPIPSGTVPPPPPSKTGVPGPPPLPVSRGSAPPTAVAPQSTNGDEPSPSPPSRRGTGNPAGNGNGDDEYEFDEGEEGDDGKQADKYVRGSVAEGTVKLAKTIRVFEEKAENRFVSDFVPPVRGGDPLVDASLKSFGVPSKILMRNRTKFKKVNAKKAKFLEYEVDVSKEKKDEAAAARATKAEKKEGLTDLFAAPTADEGKTPSSPEAKVSVEDEKISDAEAAASLVKGELIQHVTEDAARTQVTEHAGKLREDGIFWRFHPEFDYKETAETTICKRVPVPLWQRDPGMQFLVTVKNLEFSLGAMIEPFFCTLGLYDLKTGSRLSENFHFDLNPADVLTGHMEVSKSLADKITLAKHAVFSVTDRHEKIYLVLKIERVLQGDPAELADLYVRPKPKRTPVELQALSKKARQATIYLSDFRQTFAWGMMQLFEDTGELKLPGGPNQKIEKLYIQNESMKDEQMVALAREVEAGRDKNLKLLPSSFLQLRIDELDAAMPPNRVDPSTIALKDTEEVFKIPEADEKDKPIVKEIEEFVDRPAQQPIPNTFFVNLLYVYPERINFEKFRNIACNIQIRTSDVSLTADGLKVIPGKSSTSAFTTSALTQVNYHKKAPYPQEEIKIMLPLNLTTTSHLFFTFYKVSIKKKPGKREIIGYSVLPLYMKGRLLADEVHDLRIASKLPKNYMIPFWEGKETEDVQFRNGGVKSFQCRVKVVSSIFNQDPHLNDFFGTFPGDKELTALGKGPGDDLLRKSINSLSQAAPFVCIKFLPSLLNYMTELVAQRSVSGSKLHAFYALAIVVDKVSGFLSEGNRCSLLVAYLQHKFDNPGMPIFQLIADLWLHSLERRSTDESGDKDANAERDRDRLVIQHSWFFFELIFKSMAIERQRAGVLSEQQQADFAATFKRMLSFMVQLMYKHRSTGLTALKHLINNLALFFSDLFAVLDKERVIVLVEWFLHEFRDVNDDPVLVEFKFTFYGILFDNDFFVDLCEPSPLELPPSSEDDAPDVIELIRAKYRLPALLIDDFVKNLSLEESFIKEKVVNALRSVLTKLDYDARFPDIKSELAMMFLPLVPAMVGEIEAISNMEIKMKRMTLVCLLWVLKNVDKSLLRLWWADGDEVLTDFIQLLDLCIHTFPYMGVKHREGDQAFDTILGPESMNSFMDGGAGTATAGNTVADMKSNIESMMSNLHVKGGRGGATLASRMAARSRSATLSSKSSTSSTGGSAGRSTLRAMRANLVGTRNDTAGSRRTGTYRKSNANTLTVSSREYLMKLVRWEGVLSHHVSQTVLGVMVTLFDDKRAALAEKSSSRGPGDLLIASLKLICSLLSTNQPTVFLLGFYPVIRIFLQRFGDILFTGTPVNRLVSVMAGDVFRQCTYYSQEVRTNALAVLYLLLRNNFSREGLLSELEVALTVYLSKMVSELKPMGEKYLKQALIALPMLSTKSQWSDPQRGTKFSGELATLLNRLNTILADSMEITRQSALGEKSDPTTSEALLIQVADAFSHMPETRVTWLNRLAEHHKRLSNFAEAGQCYILIANLCRDKRISFGGDDAADGSAPPPPTAAGSAGENEVTDEAVQKSVAYHLEQACKMLDKADLFEQCADVYKAVLPIFEKNKDYKKLAAAHLHLHQIFDRLIEANKKQTRMLGTYYRIGFYGRKFGARLDGNEFIYKAPKITRLSEIASRMKALYSQQLGVNVKTWPDSGPIDRSKLDVDECVLQVTFVNAAFPSDEKTSRQTFIEKNTGLSRFAFSTPFTKSGGPFGSVTDQYKRNTIVHVRNSFPYLLTAQSIVSREETILEPILASCEDIDERSSRLDMLLIGGPVDAKALTGILAGCVAPQVNGGIKEVCFAFLSEVQDDDDIKKKDTAAAPVAPTEAKGVKNFAAEDQEKLRASIRVFLNVCKRGLDENKKLCQTDGEHQLQANLDKQFDELCSAIRPLIKERKRVKIQRKGVRFGSSA